MLSITKNSKPGLILKPWEKHFLKGSVSDLISLSDLAIKPSHSSKVVRLQFYCLEPEEKMALTEGK